MDLLTQRQLARLSRLPKDHRVVAFRNGCPIVRRPDGQVSLVQPNGQLAATTLVQRVQSYLSTERC